MLDLVIKNGLVINEGESKYLDIGINNGRIEQIEGKIEIASKKEVDATGMWVIPGIIDDQVHFREPGLTHKATIETESKAALAGGITSFMEMPNTKPPALTQDELQRKYDIAQQTSWTNYSFYMGASNDNIEEVLRTDVKTICGIKVFMGSSTGNMLVDDADTLEAIFSQAPTLVATHCEDEETIRRNLEHWIHQSEKDGFVLSAHYHPIIRSTEGCYLSSSMAVELAKKHNTKLHILHISTAKEIELFDNHLPLAEKKITAEVCVHHLYFDDRGYLFKNNQIKCNPAIKSLDDRNALRKALVDGYFDVVATDHAPHTWEEKKQPYLQAPSGLPLVQTSFAMMLNFMEEGWITKEMVIEKMCHNPAVLFEIEERGFIREGYWADLAIVNPENPWELQEKDILYRCGWSPLTGEWFQGKVEKTFINGALRYDNGEFSRIGSTQRLTFDR